jgi:hypothetical protein
MTFSHLALLNISLGRIFPAGTSGRSLRRPRTRDTCGQTFRHVLSSPCYAEIRHCSTQAPVASDWVIDRQRRQGSRIEPSAPSSHPGFDSDALRQLWRGDRAGDCNRCAREPLVPLLDSQNGAYQPGGKSYVRETGIESSGACKNSHGRRAGKSDVPLTKWCPPRHLKNNWEGSRGGLRHRVEGKRILVSCCIWVRWISLSCFLEGAIKKQYG